MTGRFGISLNGYEITVEHITGFRKKPCLMVKTPDKENTYYKVASFNSKETADWFIEQIKKMYKCEGLTEQ